MTESEIIALREQFKALLREMAEVKDLVKLRAEAKDLKKISDKIEEMEARDRKRMTTAIAVMASIIIPLLTYIWALGPGSILGGGQ